MATPSDFWQRWLGVRRVAPTNDLFVVPAISLTGVPGVNLTGSSLIFARFTFDLTSNFTLLRVKTPPTTAFVMAVSFPGARYKLWEGVGEVLSYPLYKGEALPPTAVLECWTAGNATTISTNAFNLTLGLTTVQADCKTLLVTSRYPKTTTLYPN